MMDAGQIQEKLRAAIGDGVAEFKAPAAGDAWIAVAAEALPAAARMLRDDPALAFDLLRIVTAVDFTDRFAVVYHLYSTRHNHEVTVRVDLPREAPKIASVTGVWPAADWHEREAYDLMGIVFEGHPALERILLPEDWAGHPLRKDYVAPAEYHGISNT